MVVTGCKQLELVFFPVIAEKHKPTLTMHILMPTKQWWYTKIRTMTNHLYSTIPSTNALKNMQDTGVNVTGAARKFDGTNKNHVLYMVLL